MLCNSVVIVRTHPQAIALAIITMRKSTHTPYANMADHSVIAWNELMKARLVGPRCFVLTSFLRKVLLRAQSRLVYFAMSMSMPPEVSEIFYRKESYFSFPVRL